MQSTNTASASKPTVVYDGGCNFCLASVERLKKMDKQHKLGLVAWDDAQQQFPWIADRNIDEGMLFVGTDECVSVGADAWYEIAKLLPLTATLAWLYKLPVLNQLAKLTYWLIALNRKRLGQVCSNGICRVPAGTLSTSQRHMAKSAEVLTMIDKVSESDTGQDLPKPSREQRDEAFSTGAGRKAVEVPIEEDLRKGREREETHRHDEAPVGLELETQAHEFSED